MSILVHNHQLTGFFAMAKWVKDRYGAGRVAGRGTNARLLEHSGYRPLGDIERK